MPVEEGGQAPIILCGEPLQPLVVLQHLLNHERVYILSRDSGGMVQKPFHSDTAPSAISSMAAATSIVNSSARRNAWRRRATSISRAAI